jgi:hypothetical protein
MFWQGYFMKRNLELGQIILFCFIILIISCEKDNQGPEFPASYPEFKDEVEVIINGYSKDAMEPFISKGGHFLFFNSLNDGDSTSLYYASRLNDTVFEFKGEIVGVNGQVPHLDAVASMDDNDIFYFVSTRDYPSVFENYQSGKFDNGIVTDVRPVMGDFYIYNPGWLIMDAEISRDGSLLYYVNARFTGGPLPAEAILGIAEKQDSTFKKSSSSDDILKNVNDSNYLIYAPCISSDGNELYFTRIPKGVLITQICVSVRDDNTENFSAPQGLEIEGNSVEAPSLTDDGERLYYHKRLRRDDKYHIFTMKRE